LLLALSLETSGLVLSALAHSMVPELSELVRNSVDGMRRMNFVIGRQRRLNVRNVHQAVILPAASLATPLLALQN
jgi:hypothetical protein